MWRVAGRTLAVVFTLRRRGKKQITWIIRYGLGGVECTSRVRREVTHESAF
jgi:hypothetical protein